MDEVNFMKMTGQVLLSSLHLQFVDLQMIVKLTTERDNAKEVARQEIEMEKRELEEKIASLYEEITQNNVNRDQFMAQLHSR